MRHFPKILGLSVLFSSVGALSLPACDTASCPKSLSLRDVPYREAPAASGQRPLTLDCDAPTSASAPPLVMFVHGGAWQVGDKKSARDGYVPAFLKAGYAFCAVNYGLFPVSTPEQAADDIAAALAFARSNAKAWRFDPDRLVLIGHSAGAHLVALVALDARYLQRHQVPKDSLRALVLLDGAGYDIAWQVANGRNAELYQKVFGPSPDTWQRLSPLTYAPGGGPASLIHYIAARAPSRAQATALAGALRKAGTRVDLNAVTGETHSSIHRGFGAADDATTQKTFSFLAEVVSPTLPAPSR